MQTLCIGIRCVGHQSGGMRFLAPIRMHLGDGTGSLDLSLYLWIHHYFMCCLTFVRRTYSRHMVKDRILHVIDRTD